MRPTLPTRNVAAVTSNLTATRYNSNVPSEEPKKKAQSILDSLPGNSLVSKSAILSAAAGLSVAAISNELYVFNEETVAAFCVLSVFTAVAKYGGPAYREWAEKEVQKQKDILNAAREDHTSAVKQRMDNVNQLSGVVDVTKQLFAVSKVNNKTTKQNIKPTGNSECSVADVSLRKPLSLRLRPTNLSSAPPLLLRPSRFLTRGCVTRVRLSSASSVSLPRPSSARSTRSLRTPRFCSRSSSRALLTLSVSQLHFLARAISTDYF